MRRTMGEISEISLCFTRCLTAGICAGCMENSRKPMPSSSRVRLMSPATSPHIETGLLAFSALLITCDSSISTAGCSGSYRCETCSSLRSIARVYWIKSLVPIEIKSKRRRKRPMAAPAFAGATIIGNDRFPPQTRPCQKSIWVRRPKASAE